MGFLANVITRGSTKAAGIGWPNPGWAPPPGYAGKSITDITVNGDTAMTVSAFHAGVRLIAEDIAAMPLAVFERTPDRGAVKAETHPAYRMLHDVANPEMTAMVWRETMLGHGMTWGNCYSERVPNGMGQAVELWPLRPDRMTVTRDPATRRRVYDYLMPDGSTVRLPESRVFHVPFFGFDGLVGYSLITMARRSLENAIAIEEYGLQTFANGAEPGVVITHPQQLSAKAKANLKTSWEEQHQGLTNAQRTAILDEGMSIEKIGFAPEDAQFLEAKRHSVEEVARWLRLAPHKLSDLSRATFSNIEESNLDHVIGTLTPKMVRFEQQLNKDILSGAFYAKHNAASLLRGNTKDRAEFYSVMRQQGLLTDDEIRAFEDLNALSAEDRQKLLFPLNSVPASAYDEHGMTMVQRVTVATALAKAGYDPAASLAAFALPEIPHTGFLPVTVQSEPAIPAEKGELLDFSVAPPEFHLHLEKGAISNETSVLLPDSISIPEPPAPIVHVAGPIVNTIPPDLTAVASGLRELRARIDAPVTKSITRDERGQITSITETKEPTDG